MQTSTLGPLLVLGRFLALVLFSAFASGATTIAEDLVLLALHSTVDVGGGSTDSTPLGVDLFLEVTATVASLAAHSTSISVSGTPLVECR